MVTNRGVPKLQFWDNRAGGNAVLIAESNRSGPVETVIRSARRRRVYMIALEESGLALCLVLSGVLLMLLLGAQILRWYWLVVLGILGTVIAGYRVYVRRLSPYRIAQLIDSRLRLSDSLSTACFLLSETPRRQDAAAHFQIRRAERLATGVNTAGIFRFRGGRAWAGAAALAAVAFGLFAVRYLVTNSLSIQQAIVPLRLGEVIEHVESRLFLPGRKKQQPEADRPRSEPPTQGTRANMPENAQGDARDFESAKANGATASFGQNQRNTQVSQSGNQTLPGQAGGQSDASPNSQRPADAQLMQTPSQGRASQQAANREDEPGLKSQNSPGLMDKMKEALSSLMTKLQQKENSRNADQGDQSTSQEKNGDQSAAARDRNGNSQRSTRNGQDSQEQNGKGALRGQTTEKAQASQNRSGDESSDQKSANSHSGIGHTNGDKEIKDAEQLKAMGKLAEIIGKRSANLTGDVTVETSSTNQQLRTQYSGRVGEHADLGGEINRDEVPVMYRDYVREYMQLVHKQADQQH